MRIFYSFLIVFVSVLFAVLPFTGAVHSLLSDLREDHFTITTDNVTTTGTVQLFKELYDDDVSSISFLSHDTDDAPIYSSYNTTSRALVVAGLAVSTTRVLDVTYDVDAVGNSYFSTAITTVTYIWLIMIGLFAVGSLIYLWWGPVRDRLSRG